MAQYIEKEALIKLLDERGYFKHAIYKSVIEDFPTADVVPKSEVDWHREAELNAKRIMELEAELSNAKQEVAREIFGEIEEVLNELGYFDKIDFRFLKKKYTDKNGNIPNRDDALDWNETTPLEESEDKGCS